jgi:signal peptide peptidase SppA
MKNHRLAERIFNTPLMIAEDKLATILHVMGPRFDLDVSNLPKIDARELSPKERAESGYAVSNGTAIIPISGTLVHRSGYLDALSGLTSYENLRRTFDTAMDDDAVRRIIFDVDSPGGEVSGCFDLADHIYRSRGKKHMLAIVNESCYSAAYALASAADRIVIPRTGGAGSVGVILCHVDQSKHNEKTGLAVTHIFAGSKKADFSPHSPLSEEAKGRLQEMVGTTYSLFAETVARNRGMSVETVRKTEAGIFVGKKAVAIGFADEVAAADKYLSGSHGGAAGPGRMAAEAPTQAAPAIEVPKSPAQAAHDHFASPATSSAAYEQRPAIDRASDREKAHFKRAADRDALRTGGTLSSDTALILSRDTGKRPAECFGDLTAAAFANLDRSESPKKEQAAEPDTRQSPEKTNRTTLADIAAKVYGDPAE